MQPKSTSNNLTEQGWPAMHPGELLEDLLESAGISVVDAASRMHVSRQTVHAIAAQARGVTPEMALRLSRLFGGDPELWLTLQHRHDLETTRSVLGEEIERIRQLEPA
jgi:antitoxin HigA-1